MEISSIHADRHVHLSGGRDLVIEDSYMITHATLNIRTIQNMTTTPEGLVVTALGYSLTFEAAEWSDQARADIRNMVLLAQLENAALLSN